MDKDTVRKERQRLLSEIDEIQKECVDCKTRYEYNKAKDSTGLKNACSACPVGQKLSRYGEKFLELTRKFRKAFNKSQIKHKGEM